MVKPEVDSDGETSAKRRERNNNEMNGRPTSEALTSEALSVGDGYNYCLHSSHPKKVSLNTSEPLVEVEETTVGH